jgi:hypothetical protein
MLRHNRNTSDEESVSSKNCTLVSVFDKVADAILRVARSMQCGHGNPVSDFESLAMLRYFRNRLAVLSSNNSKSAKFCELESMSREIILRRIE